MPRVVLAIVVAAIVGGMGCGEAATPAAHGTAPQTPAPAANPIASTAERAQLLAFLRRQDPSMAERTAAELDQVAVVRLDADYTAAELASLARLPGLREVMIWRDGEGPPGSEGSPAPTDADLAILASLPQVERLSLGGWSAPCTDAGIEHLVRMPALRRLDLIQVQGLSDAAMQSVARMPRLETLDITYTKVRDVGLEYLLASTSLRVVHYGWAAESAGWLASFRRAHPDARFVIE